MINAYNKKNGFITIPILFAWLTFVLIILSMFAVEIYLVNVKAEVVQDDIVLSNLATYKNIDLQALGDVPPAFKFNDPYAALQTFKNYLMKNMVLDSGLAGIGNSIAVGKVNIDSYIIYNIIGHEADIYVYNGISNTFSETIINDINTDPVVSPSGVTVNKTSIYTKLSFNIDTVLKSITGNAHTVSVQADTDITN